MLIFFSIFQNSDSNSNDSTSVPKPEAIKPSTQAQSATVKGFAALATKFTSNGSLQNSGAAATTNKPLNGTKVNHDDLFKKFRQTASTTSTTTTTNSTPSTTSTGNKTNTLLSSQQKPAELLAKPNSLGNTNNQDIASLNKKSTSSSSLSSLLNTDQKNNKISPSSANIAQKKNIFNMNGSSNGNANANSNETQKKPSLVKANN